MTLVVCDQGEQVALENFLNIVPAAGRTLRLYTNNLVPSATDTEADYVEASGYGYSAHALVENDWVITPGDPTEAEYPEVTFAFSGALGNVYGYYVTEDGSPDRLLWAERFSDGPYNVTGSGISIAVTPRITASTT